MPSAGWGSRVPTYTRRGLDGLGCRDHGLRMVSLGGAGGAGEARIDRNPGGQRAWGGKTSRVGSSSGVCGGIVIRYRRIDKWSDREEKGNR